MTMFQNLANSSYYLFDYQPYDTLGLNRDLLAYEVAVPNLAHAPKLVYKERLIDFTSYYSLTFKSSMHVPGKFYLGDVLALEGHHSVTHNARFRGLFPPALVHSIKAI